MTKRIHSSRFGRLTRREAIGQGLAAGGVLLVGAPTVLGARAARGQTVEDELVFASNGGSYQKVIETEIFPDFAKQYGVKKLTFVAGQPADNLAKLRVQKSSPAIDVIWLAGAVTYQSADEGLLETLDPATLPNLKHVPSGLVTEKESVPAGLSLMGVLYNRDVFKEKAFSAPTSWWDLWDPKYKGHVGSFSSNSTGQIAILSLVARELTGDYKNLDPAFAKFKELRPQVVDFFASVGALDKAIQQRDVWISLHAVQGAIQHIRAGLPIEFILPKEGSVGYTASAAVVKGAPHPRAARAWVDYLLSAEAQAKMAVAMGYVPINNQVKIANEYASLYPDAKSVFVPDWRYLTGQLSSIVNRWNRVVEG